MIPHIHAAWRSGGGYYSVTMEWGRFMVTRPADTRCESYLYSLIGVIVLRLFGFDGLHKFEDFFRL